MELTTKSARTRSCGAGREFSFRINCLKIQSLLCCRHRLLGPSALKAMLSIPGRGFVGGSGGGGFGKFGAGRFVIDLVGCNSFARYDGELVVFHLGDAA